jgi:hypothetical protein
MQQPAGAIMRLGLQVESRSHRRWSIHPFWDENGTAQVGGVQTGAVHVQWEKVELPLAFKAKRSGRLACRSEPRAHWGTTG